MILVTHELIGEEDSTQRNKLMGYVHQYDKDPAVQVQSQRELYGLICSP